MNTGPCCWEILVVGSNKGEDWCGTRWKIRVNKIPLHKLSWQQHKNLVCRHMDMLWMLCREEEQEQEEEKGWLKKSKSLDNNNDKSDLAWPVLCQAVTGRIRRDGGGRSSRKRTEHEGKDWILLSFFGSRVAVLYLSFQGSPAAKYTLLYCKEWRMSNLGSREIYTSHPASGFFCTTSRSISRSISWCTTNVCVYAPPVTESVSPHEGESHPFTMHPWLTAKRITPGALLMSLTVPVFHVHMYSYEKLK